MNIFTTPITSSQPPQEDSLIMTKKSISLTDLPSEVLMQIALILPCNDFARLLQTSRSIHIIVNSHYVWHQRFIARFGQNILSDLLLVKKSPKNISNPLPRPTSPRFPPDSNFNISNSGSPAMVPQGLPHGYYHNHQEPTSSITPSSSTSSSVSSSPTSSASSSPRLKSKCIPKDDSNAKSLASIKKAKRKKVDLRKTTEVSKEQIIRLYIQYSRLTIPAESMDICHMGDRYWKLVQNRESTFGTLAQLQSVWWMDIATDIHGVPPGHYKVQWRVKVTSDAPIINSEFTAVLFDKDEDKLAILEKPASIFYKPRNVQEFIERTNTRVGKKADRKPFRNLFKQNFTILELPGDLIIEDDYQNVHLQISNHEGWKSGLYIDYVQLVNVNDLPISRRSSQDSSSSVTSSGGSEDEVSNQGEEYYPNATGIPSTSFNWFQLSSGSGPNPIRYRSRAFRHYIPLDNDAQLDVGPSTPPETLSGAAHDNSPSPSESQQQQQDPNA
ncbi:hypothetical protein BGZ76_001773 [Entomortierella beljakovae]|nr:hypothetical protein BGZ76_001773 [Entomortierella beljakovae]